MPQTIRRRSSAASVIAFIIVIILVGVGGVLLYQPDRVRNSLDVIRGNQTEKLSGPDNTSFLATIADLEAENDALKADLEKSEEGRAVLAWSKITNVLITIVIVGGIIVFFYFLFRWLDIKKTFVKTVSVDEWEKKILPKILDEKSVGDYDEVNNQYVRGPVYTQPLQRIKDDKSFVYFTVVCKRPSNTSDWRLWTSDMVFTVVVINNLVDTSVGFYPNMTVDEVIADKGVQQRYGYDIQRSKSDEDFWNMASKGLKPKTTFELDPDSEVSGA